MATPRMRVDREWLNTNVLQNPGVRSAINQTARRLAPIVQQIALREGDRDYANSVRVEPAARAPASNHPHASAARRHASSSATNTPWKRNMAPASTPRKGSCAAPYANSKERQWSNVSPAHGPTRSP